MLGKICSSQSIQDSLSAPTMAKIGLSIFLVAMLANAILGLHDAVSSPALRIFAISRSAAIAKTCICSVFATVAFVALTSFCRKKEICAEEKQKVETLRAQLNAAFIAHNLTIDYFGGQLFINRLCLEAQRQGRYDLKFENIFISYLDPNISGNWFGSGDGKFSQEAVVKRLGLETRTNDKCIFTPKIAKTAAILMVKSNGAKVLRDENGQIADDFFTNFLCAGGMLYDFDDNDRAPYLCFGDPLARTIIELITLPKLTTNTL